LVTFTTCNIVPRLKALMNFKHYLTVASVVFCSITAMADGNNPPPPPGPTPPGLPIDMGIGVLMLVGLFFVFTIYKRKYIKKAP